LIEYIATDFVSGFTP